jgi:hypothetical protein
MLGNGTVDDVSIYTDYDNKEGSITFCVCEIKFYICIMNSKEIFSLALGLQIPCSVKEVKLSSLSSTEQELHIYIGDSEILEILSI